MKIKNKFKKINNSFLQVNFFLILVLCIVNFNIVGCATQKEVKKTEQLIIIERPERMFWEIKKGNSTVFVLGTIHLADKNFFPIEETIIKEFDSADKIVSEIGGEEELKQLPQKLQAKIISEINNNPEKHLHNFLSSEEIKILYNEIGESIVKPLFVFNPWVLSVTIPEVLFQKNGLNPEYGIDNYFIARSGEKKIEALETIEQQLNVLSRGTFEEQLKILHETIESIKNHDPYMEEIYEIKRAYLENDKKALEKVLTKKNKIMSDSEYQNFMDNLIKNRNIEWAKKFNTFLEEAKTTFVFAGAGHFLGEHSVQNILKKMNE